MERVHEHFFPARKVTWRFECIRGAVPIAWDEHGCPTEYDFSEAYLAWEDGFENLVVNVGLDDVLDKYFKGSSYTAAHYVGLKDTGTPVAGDTMGSHGSWSELTIYSDANRPTFVPGSVSGQSVDNSGSVAQFNINGTDDVYGAFLCTDNTKGGSSGTLFSVGDFASARGVVPSDLLKVTVTIDAADDGA